MPKTSHLSAPVNLVVVVVAVSAEMLVVLVMQDPEGGEVLKHRPFADSAQCVVHEPVSEERPVRPFGLKRLMP